MERTSLRSPWVLVSLALSVLLALTGVAVAVGGRGAAGVVTGVVVAALGGLLTVRVVLVRVQLDAAGAHVHRVLRPPRRVAADEVASVVRIGSAGGVLVTSVKLRLLLHDGGAVDLPVLAGFAGRSYGNRRVERQQQVLRAHLTTRGAG